MISISKSLSTIILLVISFTFIRCTTPTENETSAADVLAKGSSASIVDLSLEDLSEEEAAGILFMREEEKLARDVYNYFFEKYGSIVFSNIAASEQTHMNAVKIIIEKYGLTDPVVEDVRGIFTNPSLQELYNNLIATGENSLVEALQVGALIEEVDILDLKNQIENVTDNSDILLVYNNLMKGSYNHLKSFERNLSANEIIYEPQELDSDLYNEILNTAYENGQRGYRGGRK